MANKRSYELHPEWELRFEVQSRNNNVTLELKSGLAEIFGTELATGEKYEFLPGSSTGVFTWQGCIVELEGIPDVIYIARETPMLLYLSCHAVFERFRESAERENKRGPVAMVVGPCDVGKSSISRLLVNYALRMKRRRPIFVNLDVGQVDFAIPGTLGALLLNEPASVEKGFSEEESLIFHFGYNSPQCNETLYRHLITRLAEVCEDRFKINQREKHSGIIINTSGWTQGEGYKALMHTAQAFEVDAIIVIDQERLYNELLRDMPHFVKVVLLPKSGGVVDKSQALRIDAKNSSIHKYFHGIRKSPLHPHRIEIKFDDVNIYKIGASSVSSSYKLTGHSKNHVTKLLPVPPMKNHLVSVSFADSDRDDIVQSNVAGFLLIEEVNMQKKTLTLLSPQPRLRPNSILLLSEIKYWDNS